MVKNENFIISLHHQIFDFCTNNLHDSIAQWKQAGLACMRSWVQTQVVPIFFFFFNNFSLLFFNALVISYFIPTDMSNFFPTFFHFFFNFFQFFSIFFSTCTQHVPNLFPSFWVQKISNVELKKKKNCPSRGSNQGPSDLQHSTLPLDHEIQRESWQKI